MSAQAVIKQVVL